MFRSFIKSSCLVKFISRKISGSYKIYDPLVPLQMLRSSFEKVDKSGHFLSSHRRQFLEGIALWPLSGRPRPGVFRKTQGIIPLLIPSRSLSRSLQSVSVCVHLTRFFFLFPFTSICVHLRFISLPSWPPMSAVLPSWFLFLPSTLQKPSTVQSLPPTPIHRFLQSRKPPSICNL